MASSMGLPFPNSVQESETMLTGDEIRRARQRAGWSQGVLADKVGSSMRTVVNWETGKTAPSQKETVIRATLSGYWDADVHQSVPLASASDIELLGEIARRLGRSQLTEQREKVMGNAEHPTPIVEEEEYDTNIDEEIDHDDEDQRSAAERYGLAAYSRKEGVAHDVPLEEQ